MKRFGLLVLIVAASSCTSAPHNDNAPQLRSGASDLRALSAAEALVDFDTIVDAFRSLYGAMPRKEQRYGFSFETMASSYRARVQQAQTEAEYRGIFEEFISRFQDAHVSLQTPLVSDASNALRLRIGVMPIQDTYVIYAAHAGLPVAVGEELLSIDGRSAASLVEEFSKYVSNANPLAKKHMAASFLGYREIFMTQGIDATKPAQVQVRGVDGSVRTEALPWVSVPHLVTQSAPIAGTSTRTTVLARASRAALVINDQLSLIGARVPFFMTKNVRTALGDSPEITLKPETLTQFGLTADAAAKVNYFAFAYTAAGKRILLVRLADYEPADADVAFTYLKALLNQEQAATDVLVLDETHNPGGSIYFASLVLSVLGKQPFNGYVQRMHGDRKWIGSYANMAEQLRPTDPTDAAIFDGYARDIDAAYSANEPLSSPLPFFDVTPIAQADAQHWTKPVVMLTDELSVSCADLVPLVFKSNGMGVLFGQTTMGGGGNVETVATLPNTQAELQISRGLGTVYDPTGVYPEASFIEDNGVTPDVVYDLKLDDYRAGFVDYVNSFTAVAVSAASH